MYNLFPILLRKAEAHFTNMGIPGSFRRIAHTRKNAHVGVCVYLHVLFKIKDLRNSTYCIQCTLIFPVLLMLVSTQINLKIH